MDPDVTEWGSTTCQHPCISFDTGQLMAEPGVWYMAATIGAHQLCAGMNACVHVIDNALTPVPQDTHVLLNFRLARMCLHAELHCPVGLLQVADDVNDIQKSTHFTCGTQKNKHCRNHTCTSLLMLPHGFRCGMRIKYWMSSSEDCTSFTEGLNAGVARRSAASGDRAI